MSTLVVVTARARWRQQTGLLDLVELGWAARWLEGDVARDSLFTIAVQGDDGAWAVETTDADVGFAWWGAGDHGWRRR